MIFSFFPYIYQFINTVWISQMIFLSFVVYFSPIFLVFVVIIYPGISMLVFLSTFCIPGWNYSHSIFYSYVQCSQSLQFIVECLCINGCTRCKSLYLDKAKHKHLQHWTLEIPMDSNVLTIYYNFFNQCRNNTMNLLTITFCNHFFKFIYQWNNITNRGRGWFLGF